MKAAVKAIALKLVNDEIAAIENP
ncbi:hypothetical protein [Mesorhizobium sp. M0909]